MADSDAEIWDSDVDCTILVDCTIESDVDCATLIEDAADTDVETPARTDETLDSPLDTETSEFVRMTSASESDETWLEIAEDSAAVNGCAWAADVPSHEVTPY